ncbi:DUF3865 domain-containing protein [Flagellimonas myxillae]|uniref:DUF3865 domain-containing protein n=1 Tax=Flagellimonas myxillae TaxID=2942214 RepID=UPI00201F7D9E|nr:DUF3865 domain-containing protein [Muricauda myxillae]MCL6268157.1 DUF3865 domain-containing protein [Muricauda myxillae]
MDVEVYIKELKKYNSINRDENPFHKTLNSLGKIQLQAVLLQYSYFPKNIVAILVSATYNLSFNGCSELSSELIRNINEELGVYSEETALAIPEPHYTILRKALLEGLNIEIGCLQPSVSTETFINKLFDFVNQTNINIALGAIFALESSAIPELEIVLDIVKKRFSMENRETPKYLLDFFLFHINEIEIGHRDRFFELCSMYLSTKKQKIEFELGFKNVLKEMDKWWFNMYEDIVHSKTNLAKEDSIHF